MPRSGNIYYSMYPEEGEDSRELVLIHGAGGTSEVWPYQLRRLPNWRVFAVDLPAHGKSDGGPEKTLEGYAARLREWMGRIGIGRASLVGHSMGAAIALMLALQAPEQVDRLILLGGAVRFQVNPNLLEKLRVPLQIQQGVNLLVGWSFARTASVQGQKTYSAQLMANRPGVLHRDFAACAAFELGERANEIRRPVHLLCGDEDVMVPLRWSEELAKLLPHGKVEVIRGGGHMLMQEKSQEVLKAIEKTLEIAN